MTATLRRVAATTSASGSPPSASMAPSGTRAPSALELRPEIVSSSVWAGGQSPVILALFGPGGRLNDTSAQVTVQLEEADGAPVGRSGLRGRGAATRTRRRLLRRELDIPSPGAWRFAVIGQTGALPLTGSTRAGHRPGPGRHAGAREPRRRRSTHRPWTTWPGTSRVVTTDPIPDRRLSARSTTDALADHVPFVLVLDFEQVPRHVGMWPCPGHGQIPARPVAGGDVHPPRAVPLLDRDRHARPGRRTASSTSCSSRSRTITRCNAASVRPAF